MPIEDPVALQGLASTGGATSKPKRAMILRMSIESVNALKELMISRGPNAKGPPMHIELGTNGSQQGIHIGGQFFDVTGAPEESPHEIYTRRHAAAHSGRVPLQLCANVSNRLQVVRVLDEAVESKIRKRSEQAEKVRTARKVVQLDVAPEAATKAKKRKTTVAKSTLPPPGRHPLPPRPLAAPGTTKQLVAHPNPPRPIASTAVASSRLTPGPRSDPPRDRERVPLQTRIIHCIALTPQTTLQIMKSVEHSNEKEVSDILREVAKADTKLNKSAHVAPLWNLKPETYKDVGVYTWSSYEPAERLRIASDAKRAFDQLGLPPDAPERLNLQRTGDALAAKYPDLYPKSQPSTEPSVASSSRSDSPLPPTRPSAPKVNKVSEPARDGDYAPTTRKGGIIKTSDKAGRASGAKGKGTATKGKAREVSKEGKLPSPDPAAGGTPSTVSSKKLSPPPLALSEEPMRPLKATKRPVGASRVTTVVVKKEPRPRDPPRDGSLTPLPPPSPARHAKSSRASMSGARDSPKPLRTARSPLPLPTSPQPAMPSRMGRASSSDAIGAKRKRPPRDDLEDEIGFIESAARAVYESDSRGEKKELHRAASASSLPLPSKPKRLKEDALTKSEPKDPPSRVASVGRSTPVQASGSSSRSAPAPNGVSVKTVSRSEPPKTNGVGGGGHGSRRKRVAEHSYTSSDEESAPTPQPSRPAGLPPRPASPRVKPSAASSAPPRQRPHSHPTAVEAPSPPKQKPRPPKFTGPPLTVLLGPLPTEHSALRERWSDCYVHYSSLWARLTAEMHQSEKLLRNNGNDDAVDDEDVEMLDADEVESMKRAYNALHQKLKDIREALGFRD
ncbi:hypothetical protein BOTBODRAFT_26196 [Botryobasidium botryosum FD-172 SS1]|uniref:RNA polymerase II elongation factor ELL N-terminal domain-containing protein n=1 Tax=Botryobasidium botryosum (strain FD-172 SS1) TaxID=930990 RepID=A0A067N479_BOTB1|nr:hypothetical protein BOTBODRAFT_26196 [Botryobasidium botryosum FD-172 SS1]